MSPGRLITKYSCVLLGVISMPHSLSGQSLEHVKEFYVIDGNVQFLPGGYVVVIEDDGQKSYYALQGSIFRPRRERLPAHIEQWTAFDWEGIDHLNQIDRRNFDPDLNKFLPPSRKVKKVLYIPLLPKGETLVLICYALKSTDQFARPDGTDIFVTGVLDTEPDQHKLPKFKKLWERKFRTDADYGELVYEEVPGVGKFVLLYSSQTGGAVVRTLDVYQVRYVQTNSERSARPRK